ncbi:hypothetical protein KQX54_021722 [Cotesia glomerata]|uniref:Uncharacterized protein n=1 Tax=Cotesia glomerata TaxID=32391 RepID=A0AAV7JA81_COTGL|nr:hypothetical protein KQX54_021722 [Cotesia glomerata]
MERMKFLRGPLDAREECREWDKWKEENTKRRKRIRPMQANRWTVDDGRANQEPLDEAVMCLRVSTFYFYSRVLRCPASSRRKEKIACPCFISAYGVKSSLQSPISEFPVGYRHVLRLDTQSPHTQPCVFLRFLSLLRPVYNTTHTYTDSRLRRKHKGG